jgi:hypothetical protein
MHMLKDCALVLLRGAIAHTRMQLTDCEDLGILLTSRDTCVHVAELT